MKAILFLCVLASALTLRAQQTDDIPTVTLPQIGTGPALLIFVSEYSPDSSFPPLPGVMKDKPAMVATVQKLGFTDITVLENPTRLEMDNAMTDFGRAAAKTPKASFFYFSGHGVLHNKLNYLIPAKANIRTQGHLETSALPAEHVTAFVAGKQTAGPCLFFVDACRDNSLPATEKGAFGDGVVFQRQAGMFIGYSTDEGKTSGLTQDGSFFTASLAKRLLTAGRSLDDLFAGVVADVEQTSKTKGAQVPQPPQKESRLRYVLQLVPEAKGARVVSKTSPEDQGEVTLLRRENEALRRALKSEPGAAANLPPPVLEGSFTNSLGMVFLPVPGTKVLMCIHETRNQDFAAFKLDASMSSRYSSSDSWVQGAGLGKGQHPVLGVESGEALSFCSFLSAREGRTYRLPTIREWSLAAGMTEEQFSNLQIKVKSDVVIKPPTSAAGKLIPFPLVDRDQLAQGKIGNFGFRFVDDGFAVTAPVMRYLPNSLGFYDLVGNALELNLDERESVVDESANGTRRRIITQTPILLYRGGSFRTEQLSELDATYTAVYASSSSYSSSKGTISSKETLGFRIVLENPEN